MIVPTNIPAADRQYVCPWCKHASNAASTSCPACGAPVDVRVAVAKSGWSELPRIKDMARIQFGNSFCQIEGNYVPVADFKLAAGDGVYFAHHLMLWKDDHAQIGTMPMARAWNRLFAGLPLVMTQAMGPGRIAFSKDQPGELIALPLDPGQSVDSREHVFMVATHGVNYDWQQSGIWFQTQGEKTTETHYPIGMFIDTFTAGQSPGLLILHGAGNVFTRDLQPGETILIQPAALLFKDSTVSMSLHLEYPGNTWQPFLRWANRYMFLRLKGPGRVAVQSHFAPVEDEGEQIVGTSGLTTERRWRTG